MPDQETSGDTVQSRIQQVCLAHLSQTSIVVPYTGRENGLRICVRFSKHCYTESFDPSVHSEDALVMDHRQKRAFDQLRYDLSKALPDIVRALPGSKVFGTPEKNFFQVASRIDGGNGEYRMFFRLKKSGVPEGHELIMRVESAYSPDLNRMRPVSEMQKVRFNLLAQKTYQGQSINFNRKR